MVISVDSTKFKFSSTGNLNIIENLSASYSETGLGLGSHLGRPANNPYSNMKCFMYRFLIINSIIDVNTLYTSSSTSFTCLVESCSSPCPTAFILDSKTVCIASKSNQGVSGNNTSCKCDLGCSNEISCLNPLSCKFNSTYFNNSNLYCLCGDSGTSTSCSNPGCHEECFNCTTYYSCIVCKDPNSEPAYSNGCKCKLGYINTATL